MFSVRQKARGKAPPVIVRKPTETHLGTLLAMQGSVVPRITPLIALVMAFTLGIWALDTFIISLPHIPMSVTGVFGVALSLFLGFRNNAAYDRWWEARRLWGQLVADMRSLGRETEIFLGASQHREAVLRAAAMFIHLHRIHLRGIGDDGKPAAWAGAEMDQGALPASPCAALNQAASVIALAAREGQIDGFGQRALGERLASIARAQAGSERIAATPLPFVYSLLVLRTTWLYCLAVPFALIEPTGAMAPLFAGIIAYVFFGLTAVTEELEHPFSGVQHSLPLDAMCRTVEIALAEHLKADVPPPLTPVNGVLT